MESVNFGHGIFGGFPPSRTSESPGFSGEASLGWIGFPGGKHSGAEFEGIGVRRIFVPLDGGSVFSFPAATLDDFFPSWGEFFVWAWTFFLGPHFSGSGSLERMIVATPRSSVCWIPSLRQSFWAFLNRRPSAPCPMTR